jgi:hypothetical protein
MEHESPLPYAHYSLPAAPNLSHIDPAHALASSFFEIYFNIIPQLRLLPSKLPVLVFSHENPVWTSPLPPTCHMFRPFNMLDLTTRINGEEYKLRSSYSIVLPRASYGHSAYALPSTREINFHTHIKQQPQLYFRTFQSLYFG